MWKSPPHRPATEALGPLPLTAPSSATPAPRPGGSCRSCVAVCEHLSGGGGWERMAWAAVARVCLKSWKCLRGSLGYPGPPMTGTGVAVPRTHACPQSFPTHSPFQSLLQPYGEEGTCAHFADRSYSSAGPLQLLLPRPPASRWSHLEDGKVTWGSNSPTVNGPRASALQEPPTQGDISQAGKLRLKVSQH